MPFKSPPILVIDDNPFWEGLYKEKSYAQKHMHERKYQSSTSKNAYVRKAMIKYETQSTKLNYLEPSKLSPPLATIAEMFEQFIRPI